MKKLAWSALMVLLTIGAMAQTNPTMSQRSIKVSGEASDQYLPDKVKVFFNITGKEKLYDDALSSINDKAGKIVKKMRSLGYKEEQLETQNFNIRLSKKYDKGKAYDDGYVASQQLVLEMKADSKEIIKVIEASAESDAEPNVSFNFFFSKEKEKEIEKELIKRAVKDAGDRALWLTEAAGESLGSIVYMTYGSDNSDTPVPMMKSMAAMRSESSDADYGGFNFSKIECSEQVNIIWSLK